MKNEEHPLFPKYDFDYIDGDRKVYVFRSVAGVVYASVFRPSGYIFPDLPLDIQQNVFEFAVTITEKPIGKLPASDNLIPNTIAAIFKHFFKNNQRIAVYVCDTADMRASSRVRKFNQWYEWYRGNEFFKVDLQMGRDAEGQRYFTSIMLHFENPDMAVIIVAFRNLVAAYNK